MTHPVPLDMLETGHVLVVGTTGSGKTYLMRGLAERLRDNGRRIAIVDKLGVFWGLTLDGNGRDPGLEFVIFGGRQPHAIPMTPVDGGRLGRIVIEKGVPAIFDLSQWKPDEQEAWVADFADAVFEANYGRGPLHLVLDEAQSWAPQGAKSEALGSVRRLIEQGRGNGVLLTLAVQRLARLDITTRNLVAGVVALRQTGVADRKAVVDLVGGQAPDVRALSAELPLLATGEGFVWNPASETLERSRFPANRTFDSSRTPRHGEAPAAPTPAMGPLVEELRALLAPAPADPHPGDIVPGDPEQAYARGTEVGQLLAERDARIAELEEQLAAAGGRGHNFEEVGRAIAVTLEGFASEASDAAKIILASLDEMAEPPVPAPLAGDGEAAAVGEPSTPAAAPGPSTTAGDPKGSGSVRGRRALDVLAAVSPLGLTEERWAFASGFSRKGGTWQTYRTTLKAAALIEQSGSLWRATEAGLRAASPELPVVTFGAGMARAASAKISGVKRLVEVLIRRWPHLTTREALASEAGLAADGGTYSTYLGRLRSAGLIEEADKRLRLNPALMEPIA